MQEQHYSSGHLEGATDAGSMQCDITQQASTDEHEMSMSLQEPSSGTFC